MEEGPKILFPEDDEFLSVEEILLRLRREFAFVAADYEAGAAGIDDAVQYYLERKGRLTGEADFFDDRIQQLRDIRHESALVVVSDRSDYKNDYLVTFVEPGEPIFFGFCSAAHEAASLPLVKRVADALEYEIE